MKGLWYWFRKLFPKDGQLRIVEYDDGHARIQEYHAGVGHWQTYCRNEPFPNGYTYPNRMFDSFKEAKEAYDSIQEGRSMENGYPKIVRKYP